MHENKTLLSPKTIEIIEHWKTKYPEKEKRSAVIAALTATQEQNHGYLTTELMDAVAEYLDLPKIWVYEVATFYDMYDIKPAGKHKIRVCTNISCMLRGSDEITTHLKNKLGIDFNETTPDDLFTLKEAECLAACTGAPMMQVDLDYHENLSAEKVDQIIDELTRVNSKCN